MNKPDKNEAFFQKRIFPALVVVVIGVLSYYAASSAAYDVAKTEGIKRIVDTPAIVGKCESDYLTFSTEEFYLTDAKIKYDSLREDLSLWNTQNLMCIDSIKRYFDNACKMRLKHQYIGNEPTKAEANLCLHLGKFTYNEIISELNVSLHKDSITISQGNLTKRYSLESGFIYLVINKDSLFPEQTFYKATIGYDGAEYAYFVREDDLPKLTELKNHLIGNKAGE